MCLSNREIFSTHLVRLPQKNQMNTNQNNVFYPKYAKLSLIIQIMSQRHFTRKPELMVYEEIRYNFTKPATSKQAHRKHLKVSHPKPASETTKMAFHWRVGLVVAQTCLHCITGWLSKPLNLTNLAIQVILIDSKQKGVKSLHSRADWSALFSSTNTKGGFLMILPIYLGLGKY